MEMTKEIYSKARFSRDKRFDGMFFIAVHTTKIFCRPICPANPPKEKNVSYYISAAAALDAGYRPCLRCRPETAPGSPVWKGTETTVDRALNLIRNGFLNDKSVEDLSDYLGISTRHLRRLFQDHLGTTPIKVAQSNRLFFAKQLIMESNLPITEIAFASGFKSVRRLNAVFKKLFDRSPSEMRKREKHLDSGLKISLPYRLPYNFKHMLSFFKDRCIDGVEDVSDTFYKRHIRLNETFGSICVSQSQRGNALELDLKLNKLDDLFYIVQNVKRMFDLDTNIEAVYSHLKNSSALPELFKEPFHLPGSWDLFEFSIRAILGQQISVKAATTLATRIADRYGKKVDLNSTLLQCFPNASELAEASFSDIGLTKTRTQTLIDFVKAVNNKDVLLTFTTRRKDLLKQLVAIKGIGYWTAHYISMRGLSDPDAFPDTDLGVIKAFKKYTPDVTQGGVKALSEQWKPWRSYATLSLWNALQENHGRN